MSEANWKEERENILERLRKAEQIAAESQAEAAVCRDLLEDCYKAASQALVQNDISLLPLIARTSFFHMPTKADTEQWGKYFLDAYARDAGWLEDTKKALEQIKADAEELLKNKEINDDLREMIKRILSAAQRGLIVHI